MLGGSGLNSRLQKKKEGKGQSRHRHQTELTLCFGEGVYFAS
jgi:hypothetical protein